MSELHIFNLVEIIKIAAETVKLGEDAQEICKCYVVKTNSLLKHAKKET